jgi:hypothetical protein
MTRTESVTPKLRTRSVKFYHAFGSFWSLKRHVSLMADCIIDSPLQINFIILLRHFMEGGLRSIPPLGISNRFIHRKQQVFSTRDISFDFPFRFSFAKYRFSGKQLNILIFNLLSHDHLF